MQFGTTFMISIFLVFGLVATIFGQDWKVQNCGGRCPNNCEDRSNQRSSCRSACDQLNYIGARCLDRNRCFCDNVCPLPGEDRKPGDRSPRCPELNGRRG